MGEECKIQAVLGRSAETDSSCGPLSSWVRRVGPLFLGGSGDEFPKKKMYAHSSADKEGEDKCFCISMSQHANVLAPNCFSSK